ncbi:MAG: hypothetical protein ACM3IK_07970 [Sphingomonadaceae bacterium]
MRARLILWLIPLSILLIGTAQAAEIAIVQPANEETIHSNQGDLTVQVAVSGGAPDGSVQLVLDGAVLPHSYRANVIELIGIDRGTHTLQAMLLDAKGERLAASQPVTFYMWHASRLFPSHK